MILKGVKELKKVFVPIRCQYVYVIWIRRLKLITLNGADQMEF